MKRLAFALFGLTALLSSCDNEIDVTAPFEETTVVYAALNASDPFHYIRITRAFLGDEGFFGGYNQSDSLYYDSLSVVLEQLNTNGGVVATYQAVKDNSVKLDSGFFTTEGYHVYRVTATLDEDAEYRVRITRPEGGEVTARTVLVKDFDISYPRFATVNPASVTGMRVQWDQAVNARVYRAKMIMHYVELSRSNKADSVRKSVVYTFPYFTGDNLTGGGEVSTGINLDQFYGNIATQLDVPGGDTIRIHRRVDVVVEAGGDDLATAINVSQPQTGILQDPPLYTNVNGGVGVFSTIRLSYALNKRMTETAIDELVYGDYTCGLKFGKVTTSDTLFCQ